MAANLPTLNVEGKDDISVISALLLRHGVDTQRGAQHLKIKDLETIENVLSAIPDGIRASTDRPIGFVLDIDIELTDRWTTIKSKLIESGFVPPPECPPSGLIGRLKGYQFPFGVWLMPDCRTDETKLENLCTSLIRDGDPLWSHAKSSVVRAAELIDEANRNIQATDPWERFREVDRIKAEVHTWSAWQKCPGAPMGAAINSHILRHDSQEALAFLKWLRELYGFSQLAALERRI